MGTMKQREFLNWLFQISQLGGRPVCSFRPFIIYHTSKSRMCRNNTCAKTIVTHFITYCLRSGVPQKRRALLNRKGKVSGSHLS